MRLICGPADFVLPDAASAQRITLYDAPAKPAHGSAGRAARQEIVRRRLKAAPRAWDFLSIALSVMAADEFGARDQSPDGWTREFELDVAVTDPTFWRSQSSALADAFAFLSTDRWTFRFHPGGVSPPSIDQPEEPPQDCVVLLSGGLDSLVGAIDLPAHGRKPFAVSKTVKGDAEKQVNFAQVIGGGLPHLQLNDNVSVPNGTENSQRARSLIFVAFGIIAATALEAHRAGNRIPLYLCENGLIAINPPLTSSRLGSLSTRTAHPVYLKLLQRILDAAEMGVQIANPYAEKTKGEMLRECADQTLLSSLATRSTSCGRFLRFNYHHCGRCVPCQVRRAAFQAWEGSNDLTEYVYRDLGRPDSDHAAFDDVRSVAIALSAIRADGIEPWLGHALSSSLIDNRGGLMQMLGRGFDELQVLHTELKIR